MKKLFIAVLCTVTFFSATAQDKAKTQFGQDFIKAWERHKIYTVRLVEAMPESNFTFKSQEDTRSFGEIVMHVAGANYMFSSVAMERQSPMTREALNTDGKSKAEMVKVLTASFDYAKKQLLNITEAGLKKTTPWGNPIEASTSRTFAEVFHVMREHAAHHRGQMTIYLRLKGVTPPGFID